MKLKAIEFLWPIILILMLIGGMIYLDIRSENIIKVQRDKLNTYVNKEQKIENISKTLQIAHNLSIQEADMYSLIFDYYSNKYNVPWQILAALIRIESNYNPTLKSSKDAIGLCQILESTAEPICDSLGINYKKGQTLWNEIKNMEIGFYYLVSTMDSTRSDSSIINSTKVYLGGPDYRKKIKYHRYIGNYSSSIYEEFNRLKYIYRGVENER